MENDGKITLLYLARHAQFEGNISLSLNADSDILTDRGREEVNLLGTQLATEKFDQVYSSDYARAVKTCEGVLKHSIFSANAPLIVDKRLRELNFGIFEKKSYKDALEYSLQLQKPPLEWDYPEGEGFQTAGKRMLDAIEEICENAIRSSSSSVLVVSHSAAIVSFLNTLKNKSQHTVLNWEQSDLKFMRNANYMKIEVQRIMTGDFSSGDQKPLFQFNFLEKYYRKHLSCIDDTMGSTDPVSKLSNSTKFAGCVQQ